MFSVVRFIARRFTKNRLNKSVWFRRALLAMAIGRWLLRFLDRPQVIRLRKNESATISVAHLGRKES